MPYRLWPCSNINKTRKEALVKSCAHAKGVIKAKLPMHRNWSWPSKVIVWPYYYPNFSQCRFTFTINPICLTHAFTRGYRLQKQAVDDQICELSNGKQKCNIIILMQAVIFVLIISSWLGDSDKSYVVEQRQTIQEQKAHFSKLEVCRHCFDLMPRLSTLNPAQCYRYCRNMNCKPLMCAQAKQKVTGNTIRQSLKYNTDRMSLRTKEQAELESKIQTATASLQSLKKMREQEADHQHSSCSQQLKQHDENIQHTLVHMNIHLQELEVGEDWIF